MKIKELLFGKENPIKNNKKKVYLNGTESWLPITEIKDGIVITDKGQFIKILEILPVNLNLKSTIERNNIIGHYASYLKIARDNLQILVTTQKADIESYLSMMRTYYVAEQNENCKDMIDDNIQEIEYLAEREALSRRFFLVFQYESRMRLRTNSYESIVVRLNEEAETAANYLDLCGLEVIQPDYYDNFLNDIIFSVINKKTCKVMKPPLSVFTMLGDVHEVENIELGG